MNRHLLLCLLPALIATTEAAHADDKAVCLDAVAKGQVEHSAHKLVEAREHFRVCARAECPAVVRSDCATWLAEVEETLPTVVVTAKDGAGADQVDVKVSVDGQLLTSKLDGEAVPINAGLHTFHFEAQAGSANQQVLIAEGEKNQRVRAVIQVGATGDVRNTIGERQPDAVSAPNPWRRVGWMVGATGIAALGAGTVFGVITLGEKSDHCSNNLCDPGTSSRVKTMALISDVGWIAGGVLLASGAGLVLLSPSGEEEAKTKTAVLHVAPLLSGNAGGIGVAGSW